MPSNSTALPLPGGRVIPRPGPLALLLLLLAAFVVGQARADVTVNVVDDTGQPVANGFRWLLELDNSYSVKKTEPAGPWAGPAGGDIQYPDTQNPNAPYVPGGVNASFTLGVNIHHSHAPVVCSGDTATETYDAATQMNWPSNGQPSVTINSANCAGYDPGQNYVVSVLPWHTCDSTGADCTTPSLQTGYMMSGRDIAAGQTTATVVVHPLPMATGQISVQVFEDNQSINAAYDQPAEHGLASFQLAVSDPAGQLTQDAWGNPLGTTYKYACTTADGRPAAGTRNPDGTVTCTSPAVALTPEQQPLYQYDASGLPMVDFLGDGNIYTCGGAPTDYPVGYYAANCVDPYSLAPLPVGQVVVRYLAPDKYGIEALPPPANRYCDPTPPTDFTSNDCSDMLLTGTIEGTRGNDAWVRATEPRYSFTLGQVEALLFYGFVHPMDHLASVANPDGAAPGSITGQVVYAHDMHPPISPGLSPGLPVPNAYVGLNNLSGSDEQVYTAAADPDTGAFTINNVPPGTYQLAMWDQPINAIIDYRTITVTPGQTVALGPVSVYGWFGTLRGTVFNDVNGNGLPNLGGGHPDSGIPNVPVNVRFSDGSMFANTTTGPDGSYSFDQYFPWWRFLVAEVDATRYKTTGVTSVVDDGGPLSNNNTYPPGSHDSFSSQGINPQQQADGLYWRTQQGDVVTQAVQLFQDMNGRIDWGKGNFDTSGCPKPGKRCENGGVLGQINYATTRTEEIPANSFLDGWEPGIPRVTVRLHQARQFCGNVSCSVCSATAPADATPVNRCWGIVDTAPFPLTTTSDSWDDNQPTGCVGEWDNAAWGESPKGTELVNNIAIPDCAETIHKLDQTRPGVFDGSYAFAAMPDGTPIPVGNYIVEAVTPPGYKDVGWGDRNIEFGDPKIPYLKTNPQCVGGAYAVPKYHTLYPDQQVPTQTDAPGSTLGPWAPGIQAAGCDFKQVALNPGGVGAVDFNLFTDVPKASRIWGTVWNDLMLEFDPASPNAAGNLGVAHLPVAIKDWSGTEVARFYTDQWGHFDGLVPANYDIAPPIPLGLVLALYTVAPNDPGPILDTRPGSPTNGQWITDPWYDPSYSQDIMRLNWDFYPGRSTFIDTIVLPQAAFVGNRMPLDCNYADGTPEIAQVSDVVIPQNPGGYHITITSTAPATGRGGFGAATGTVSVDGHSVPVTGWSDGAITATVPQGVAGELVVTNASGQHSVVGVTLHLAGATPVVDVMPPAPNCQGLDCGVIQAAIDGAPPGAIVVLEPGHYQENVVMWKPVTLQGKGAAVTILDGLKALENLPLKAAQFAHAQDLVTAGSISIVPGQASDFTLEQGAGVLVAGCDFTGGNCGPSDFSAGHGLIDGLTISGSTQAGGGVLVNGFAPNLRISNNEIFSNQGGIGGGIRVGENGLVGTPGNLTGSNYNADLQVDHNRIAKNGSLFSGAGGVALYAGADGYQVTDNMICGNFSAQYGGGIGHYGLNLPSPTTGNPPLIQDNWIVSNESFDEGGGIHVGGDLPTPAAADLIADLPPAQASGLSVGAGSVVINRNLIEGNKGGDDGGGIRLRRVNGYDVAGNPGDPSQWYQVQIFNNMVVDNSSADQGGGIALDDSVRVDIIGDTVAANDSTATSSDAFGGVCSESSPVSSYCPQSEGIGGLTSSNPQVAGISSFANSSELQAALTGPAAYCASNPSDLICADFSNPRLVNDIVWQNRSFYWDASANNGLGALLPRPGAGTPYWDLGVYGTSTPEDLSPTSSLLTDGVGAIADPSNLIAMDPQFATAYFNDYQATSKGAALGNFVVATFTPNGIQGDYHIAPTSPAVGAGSNLPGEPLQASDYDGDHRPARVDVGADQTGTAHTWPQ